MPVFYEIHKTFDVIQKLAAFIAQVCISRNCAKFLQQCIVTQCTDEKTSTLFLTHLLHKVPNLFLVQLFMVLHIFPIQQKHLGHDKSFIFFPVFHINKSYF